MEVKYLKCYSCKEVVSINIATFAKNLPGRLTIGEPYTNYECPSCGSLVHPCDETGIFYKFCPDCSCVLTPLMIEADRAGIFAVANRKLIEDLGVSALQWFQCNGGHTVGISPSKFSS